MSEELKNCPKCGATIPDNAPQGLCPKCLLAGAAMATEHGFTNTSAAVRAVAPKTEALAPAFPDFEILELIGQGGMGFVYKARQQRLDRIIALKILPDTLARDPAFAERFSREGRLLARLNNPHIVTVHDYGVAEAPLADSTDATDAGLTDTVVHSTPSTSHDSPQITARPSGASRYFFLVMEYVDGVNLRQAMRAGRFTPEQALSVVPKICEALQYAHDEGVLHRDIKPENILMDSKGRVKIADFGIAKLMDAGNRNPLTRPSGTLSPSEGEGWGEGAAALTGKQVLGTPHYMAPEQIEQPSTVDHRADIYSLGVVFYEMLTGELPIGRFAPPSSKAMVNEQVDAIVMRALAKERELRQQSATQVKTEIAEAADGRPHQRIPETEAEDGILKTAPCFLSTPDHLRTFKARFAQPFTDMGDLKLRGTELIFERNGRRTVIPLRGIKDVGIGHLDWWAKKGAKIAYLAITFAGQGVAQTLLLRPTGTWPEPTSDGNRHVTEWAATLRDAVKKLTTVEPLALPTESVSFADSPTWPIPVLIATVLFAPMWTMFGLRIVELGRTTQPPVVSFLGFAIIGLGAAAVVFAIYTAFTYFTTRDALAKGDLWRLSPAPRPQPGQRGSTGDSNSGPNSAQGPNSSRAGTATAFSIVLFYIGLLFSIPMAVALRLSDASSIPMVLALLTFSVITAAMISNRGLPDRGWLRGFSALAVLMALPAILFGLYFVVAMMSESGGWNPATSEAVLVPAIALGGLLLPWAAIRLHHAAGSRPGGLRQADRVAPQTAQINPWPKRVFWLVISIIVAPIVLFVLMLVVPYLAWHQRGATVPDSGAVRLAPGIVTNVGKLVVVELHVRVGGDGCFLRPRLNGNPLTSDEQLDLPVLPETVLILPNRHSESVHYQQATGVMREWHVPNDGGIHLQRFAFAFPNGKLATDAAERARQSLRDHAESPIHYRDELYLFEAPDGQYDAYRGTFRFARSHHVTVRHTPDEITSETPAVPLTSTETSTPITGSSASLAIQMLVKNVSITNAVERIGETAAGETNTKPRVFANRIVVAELEIHARPGVKAIGLNFQGADLEPGFLTAIAKPPMGVIVRPTAETHQMAFQLGRTPQSQSMLSTTVLLPLPDEAAAREVVRQLEGFQRNTPSVRVERNPRNGEYKLDLFSLPATSKGAYRAWLLFSPANTAPPAAAFRPANPGASMASPQGGEDVAAKEAKLVGTWELDLTLAKATMSFSDDHQFVTVAQVFGRQFTSTGTWKIEGGQLITRTEHSDNAESIGETEIATIITLTDSILVTRNQGKSGKEKISSLKRVRTQPQPPTTTPIIKDSNLARFELRHKLAGEMADELRPFLGPNKASIVEIGKDNRSLTVQGGKDVLYRMRTFVTVMDWPTKILRQADFEYPRDTVMNAARSFFYACAIEDDYRVFNKLFSLDALHRLRHGKGLPVERRLDGSKLEQLEKELRDTDWSGKKEAIDAAVHEWNQKTLKSLREEPGVAIGFGAKHSVTALFEGDGGGQYQLTFEPGFRPKQDDPFHYQISTLAPWAK